MSDGGVPALPLRLPQQSDVLILGTAEDAPRVQLHPGFWKGEIKIFVYALMKGRDPCVIEATVGSMITEALHEPLKETVGDIDINLILTIGLGK